MLTMKVDQVVFNLGQIHYIHYILQSIHIADSISDCHSLEFPEPDDRDD